MRLVPGFVAIALFGCTDDDAHPDSLGFTECGGVGCEPRADGGTPDAPDATAEPDSNAGSSCPHWDTALVVNPGDEIGVLTPEEFWAHRTGFVNAWSTLELYPSPYLITGPAQAGVYGSIDWSVGWFFVDPYYLDNPYLLSFTGLPGYVGAVESRCSPTVRYGPDCTVTVTVPPSSSKAWFDFFFDNTLGQPGEAQLTLVNALDAGFNYASIDTGASVNVDPKWNAGPSTIVGGVCPITKYFYHHGKSGLNNLSPDDTATRFAFAQRDLKTRITTRLWRTAPPSASAVPDVTYVTQIE